MKKCINWCDFQFHPFDDEEKGLSKLSSIHCIWVQLMSLFYDAYWCQRCEEYDADCYDIKAWFFLDMMFKFFGREAMEENRRAKAAKEDQDEVSILKFFYI